MAVLEYKTSTLEMAWRPSYKKNLNQTCLFTSMEANALPKMRIGKILINMVSGVPVTQKESKQIRFMRMQFLCFPTHANKQNKQTNKQTDRHTSEQTSKQGNEQANKQRNAPIE